MFSIKSFFAKKNYLSLILDAITIFTIYLYACLIGYFPLWLSVRLHLTLSSSVSLLHTVCPGSSDPFYIVTYYIKWVTTSWTDSIVSNYINWVKTWTDNTQSLGIENKIWVKIMWQPLPSITGSAVHLSREAAPRKIYKFMY